mgnify:CR=1 FL=1
MRRYTRLHPHSAMSEFYWKSRRSITVCSGAWNASVKVIEAMNPTAAAKAVKNSVEQENMRRVHVQDGLVLTRFLRWVKEHAGEKGLDEWTAGEYLDKLRLERKKTAWI